MTSMAFALGLVLFAAEAPKPEGVALADGKAVELPADAGVVHGSPRWAPPEVGLLAFVTVREGGRPAVTTAASKPAPGPRSYDLWTCKADGSGPRRVYPAAAARQGIVHLNWVGARVTFGLETGSGTLLKVCDLDGKEVYSAPFAPYAVVDAETLLLSRAEGVHRLDLAEGKETLLTQAPPDGKRFTDLAWPRDLSYVAARIGDDTHVLFRDKSVRVLTGLVLARPSPDGRHLVGHVPVISPTKIAVTVGAVLYRVDIERSAVEKVRDLLSPSEYLGGWETLRPRWSADSTRVQFVAAPMASEGKKYRHWYLHEVEVPGGRPRRVQDIEAYSHKTESADDGRWTIVWRKFENAGEWLILRSDASYRKLDTYLMQFSADVSADGRRLAARMEDGALRIFTVQCLATRPARRD